ncbi:MAG: O-antigen ligase family protein [Ilumatobacter sp.]|nr:O-antigen ligase family protein [Ilumatobacter sp.]
MLTLTDTPPQPTRSAVSASPKGVVALTALAVAAPFDLGIPADGWTSLHLRPLLMAMLAASAWIIVRNHRRVVQRFGRLEIAVVVWIAVGWISAALSGSPTLGAAAAIRLTAFGLLTVAARHAIDDRRDAVVVLKGLAAGLVAASIVGLIVRFAGREVLVTQHFVGSIGGLQSFTRLTRPWSNPNVAAMALGATVPALLLLRRSRLIVGAAVAIPALVMTYSRGALLAVLAAGLTIVVVRRTRADVGRAGIAIALMLVVAVASPGWMSRWDAWEPGQSSTAVIDAPPSLRLDRTGLDARVTLVNSGSRVWRAGGSQRIELAASWVGEGQDWSWGEHRWALPQDLPPGASVEMRVALDPVIPVGTFDVRWHLVQHEGDEFRREFGRATASRGIVVESAVAAADVEPVHLPAGRLLARPAIWEHALREFVGSPLVGVGPGELAVAAADDLDGGEIPGRHAHSLPLEALATTGLLGAGALFMILGGAVRRAARGARRDDSLVALVTLAGLVAVMVHGLVDWPLIYSSAAIPVALLAGVAWAVPTLVHRPAPSASRR